MEALLILAALVGAGYWWWKTRARTGVSHTTSPDEAPHRHLDPPAAASPELAPEVAFIDFETTGLDPELDRIIEVGVYIFRPGDIGTAKGYSKLANPGRPIPQRITELTGITGEMVAGAEPTGAVISAFLDHIGQRPLAAYNAKFDMAFLEAEGRRIGRRVDNNSICIMEYTKARHPDLRRYRLQDACEAFGIHAELKPGMQAHRALYDAERAMRLYLVVRQGAQPTETQREYQPRLNRDELSKYHTIRSSAKLIFQSAKDAEKIDIAAAITGYRNAISLYAEAAKVPIFDDVSHYSGEIECLNRLTLCLCKQGHGADAAAEVDAYFVHFPKDASLKTAEQIRRRVAKSTRP